jgi:hypothetical protein
MASSIVKSRFSINKETGCDDQSGKNRRWRGPEEGEYPYVQVSVSARTSIRHHCDLVGGYLSNQHFKLGNIAWNQRRGRCKRYRQASPVAAEFSSGSATKKMNGEWKKNTRFGGGMNDFLWRGMMESFSSGKISGWIQCGLNSRSIRKGRAHWYLLQTMLLQKCYFE